jgi:proline iminopeptidase
MRKTILIVSGVVTLILLIGGGYLWYSMGEPLYKPGMVRAGKNLRAPLSPPPQTDAERFWTVESDIQLHHFEHGSGRNVLVIHGGPGYPFRTPLSGLEPLAGKYRFHYYDQRGCGESTRPFVRFSGTNTYENMMELEKTLGIGAQLADIERIRQILGDDKLILIGHSWGGFLASLYAAEYPEHVQALVLVSPADMLVMPGQDSDLFETVRGRLPAAMRPEFDAYMEEYLNFNSLFTKSEAGLVSLNEQFGRYYQEAVQDSVHVTLPEQGEPGGWMVFAMYISIGQRHDYRSALQSVIAPVLVLHGADDLQSVTASRAYAEAFPNAGFQVIEGASHFAFEEQPKDFAEIVGDFLSHLE